MGVNKQVMANFSKQWVENNDPNGIKWDFDILEKADFLQADTYVPEICEGYGFIAIGRSIDNEIMLAVPVPPLPDDTEEMIQWVPYNEIIK
jgi:hypothetical protein